MLAASVKDPEHLAILRHVGFPSLVIVALEARDRILGALTLISAESGVRYDEKTVALAEGLGRRAAAAIDNARLLREVQERVEALALADRRKDEFLAMLAHELRNPLSPLAMAARIMQRANGDPAVLARQQAVIERQVRHMSRLLDDLLDVSRITRGKVTLRKE